MTAHGLKTESLKFQEKEVENDIKRHLGLNVDKDEEDDFEDLSEEDEGEDGSDCEDEKY